MRSLARWLVIVAALAPDAVLLATPAVPQKRVLVLYATRRDSQLAIIGERELPRLLRDGLSGGVDYYSEYIDQGRFPEPGFQVALRDFLRVKYQGRNFDVVIATHDLVLAFVDRNRETLFPATPVVFLSNSASIGRITNSTGLSTPLDLRGSLDVALALQPDTQHLFVVNGTASGDNTYDTAAHAQFGPFASRLSVTYLTGLPTRDLEARLAHLPAHSIAYYLVVDRDGDGQIFHPLEYLDRLAAVSNAPIYSWVDSAMDHGIVGGSLKSQQTQIRALGMLVLRVLRGERPDDIPIASPNVNVVQVDWRQVHRWGISESRIPAGALVRFREPSAWDRFKVYFIGAGLLIVVETALIAGLLVSRSRRRQTEADLRRRETELGISYRRIRDLGVRLLDAQEIERARIALELHDDVSQKIALLKIGLHAALETIPPDRAPLVEEAVSRVQDIATTVHDLSHRLHPAKLRLIGFAPAIRGLLREIGHANMTITFTEDHLPPTLPPVTMLCLYRVVQEALQNIVKYSHARDVAVRVTAGAHGLLLTIADDGIGFDVEAAWGKGLGLISMKERLEALGGRLEVRSMPEHGTFLKASVPADALTPRGDLETSVTETL